ncbi:Helix-loop-helix DNA-binding protein, partial [Metarhizium majus ARSEF 297]
MTVDATRQHCYPDFDLFHELPGLWPEVPSSHLDARATQNTLNHVGLVAQMALHANMMPEFASLQSLSQGQPWAAREAYRPPPPQSSPCSSPLQSQYNAEQQTDSRHDKEAVHDTSRRGQRCHSRSLPVGHLRHQSSVDFGEDLLRNSHDTDVDENIFADWAWGPRQPSGRRAVHEGSMQFGSDSGFDSPRGSLASASGDDMETEPSPPPPPPHVHSSEREEAGVTALSFGYRNQAFRPSWPVLRTRTGSLDAELNVASTYRALSWEYLGAAMHERKPLATVHVGPRREKLTEQQKRRNHILHEKKRRALIKEGFDDLLDLVPGVRDRGLSKSAILLRAAEWLGGLSGHSEQKMPAGSYASGERSIDINDGSREKKRRALIKEGFDDLLDLVPGVRDRGLSKSAILLRAAEWLSGLVCENKALRAQARALEG